MSHRRVQRESDEFYCIRLGRSLWSAISCQRKWFKCYWNQCNEHRVFQSWTGNIHWHNVARYKRSCCIFHWSVISLQVIGDGFCTSSKQNAAKRDKVTPITSAIVLSIARRVTCFVGRWLSDLPTRSALQWNWSGA